ncbi:hypothetical protein NQ317_005640 [Molorchus minor]|uniref:Poly(A)-specific ribonuclease RNA-binding domain-containing protein n=1 Tax=Molorchus minor TaxID=1323400 RepID=A0ABQ9K6B4_9CUCU|nr:hypothetical protein NQ317_005640 [Molorchus minor]
MREERFSKQISLETRQVDKDRLLFVTRFRSKEDQEQLEKQKYEEQLDELDNFVGFTKVLRMIVDSGKLVIGHNLCLDILHTIDKFLTPLPEGYDEFKELAHSLFPKIVDTKYMSSLDPFKDSIDSNVLKHMFDTVSAKPFGIPNTEIEEGFKGYSINDQKEHEAGYDAFITGLSFLAMWKYLGTIEGETEKIYNDLSLLEPYINKIFLMVLTDNQFINLAGEDLNPNRDHVFYLTFPKEWKNNNIVQLFSPFGNVQVSWLDDTSAYVGLYKRDQAAIALSTLSQSDTYSIMSFAKRQAILAGICTPLPSPLKAKRRKKCRGTTFCQKTKKRTVLITVIFSVVFNSGSFSRSKRSIDPIEEEQTECEESFSHNSKKVFNENEAWE